ncbi:hypothetical protein KTO58_13215 [Chitinophaga pendula]|uniref:adenosine deaminase n=1 Tax=Chitinophaga TaxID=79328 RepID=UPI000BB09467|nr:MULTISPECIES: adenosine deaminase [Chitinophaga]ASZ12299.1 adenosine deaminase [Chitinophaga sp. MD30]UCJ10112.1 hypothetical protein KTO58_13215 [Chitinophaga pendula]
MIRFAIAALLLWSINTSAQSMNDYLDQIRDNPAKLTAFFSQMPKGGDLHHHYSGSVYAESYLSYAVEKDFFVNKESLRITVDTTGKGAGWTRLSELAKNGLLDVYKAKLIQRWSVKDYNHVSYPADKQFFESFSYFGPSSKHSVDAGLLELKRRAVSEHVSYIETQYDNVPCKDGKAAAISRQYDSRLATIQTQRNEKACQSLLDSIYSKLIGPEIVSCAIAFNADEIDKRHHSLHLDDADFILRYQNVVVRNMEPTALFNSLILAFESAERDSLIVGVNILSPEDNEVSMRDYWLHMQMFKYCHQKYPQIKYAMHAGELTLGLVKPEELTWHINAAVFDAGAFRIGHGVDMAYEKDSYRLLQYMKEKEIPVEINLFSNEFILKVKDRRHPITLYKQFGVPIVISTDDAGVLRSNLTEQYVLLANRYPEFSYTEIKKIVYNSIRYAFIKGPGVKQQLIAKLDKDFERFEQLIRNTLTRSPATR